MLRNVDDDNKGVGSEDGTLSRVSSSSSDIMDSKGRGFDGRHGACLIFGELFADDACVRGPCAYGGLDSTITSSSLKKEQKDRQKP